MSACDRFTSGDVCNGSNYILHGGTNHYWTEYWQMCYSFWDEAVNRGSITDFHTLFNLVTCIVMRPCVNLRIGISKKIVKDKNTSKIDQELALLDPIFISNPSVALEQCKKVMVSMSNAVKENYDIAGK